MVRNQSRFHQSEMSGAYEAERLDLLLNSRLSIPNQSEVSEESDESSHESFLSLQDVKAQNWT